MCSNDQQTILMVGSLEREEDGQTLSGRNYRQGWVTRTWCVAQVDLYHCTCLTPVNLDHMRD